MIMKAQVPALVRLHRYGGGGRHAKGKIAILMDSNPGAATAR
jgi:hypothetical protein